MSTWAVSPPKRALRIGELYSVASRVLGKRTYPDFGEAFKDVKDLVENLRKRKYEDVLASYDAEVIEGKARFVSPRVVKVNGEIIEARKFIIAMGSSPKVPEIKGLKEAGFWSARGNHGRRRGDRYPRCRSRHTGWRNVF